MTQIFACDLVLSIPSNCENFSSFTQVNHNSASRDGEPFEALISYHKRVPDSVRRFCTQRLKIMPTNYYLKSIGWKNWSNAVGIRADEARRIKPSPVKYFLRCGEIPCARTTTTASF